MLLCTIPKKKRKETIKHFAKGKVQQCFSLSLDAVHGML